MTDLVLTDDYDAIQVASGEILDYCPNIVGFDTETTIGINQNDCPSLVQIALPNNKVYLFQLKKAKNLLMANPQKFGQVLTSRNIIKVGVDITGDARKIRGLNIEMRGIIDIQDLATTMGESSLSMDALGAKYLPNYIVKQKVYGDYDSQLSGEKIDYAARDARLSLALYLKMICHSIPICLELNPANTNSHFFLWVTNILQTAIADRTYKSIVNQALTQYSPWRNKYIEAQRREVVGTALCQFVEENHWPYDPLKERFIVQPLTIDNLPQKFAGQKYESVVRFLANTWNNNMANSLQYTIDLLGKLITEGKLSIVNGRLINPQT